MLMGVCLCLGLASGYVWAAAPAAPVSNTTGGSAVQALDETTAHRLKRLAARWQVSQAEVVRSALATI